VFWQSVDHVERSPKNRPTPIVDHEEIGRSLVTAYRANPEHTPALIDELDRTVSEIEQLAAVGTP
jgi:hypothetical protein